MRACVPALLVFCVALACHAAEPPRGRLPNIVLILVDDLGYGDLGCYGATRIKTPNIDRLAAEGRRFTDAHSASAVCTPSRYALLTGEYPFRVNCWRPLDFRAPLIIDPAKATLASLLRGRGYATAAIGKWHLGWGRGSPDWNGELKPGPLEVGFDHYFGVPVNTGAPPYVYVENRRVVGADPSDPMVFGAAAKRNPARTRPYPEKFGIDTIGGARRAHERFRDEEHTATLTARAQQWIRDHEDRPFFLYFATLQNHHPFTPAPRFQGSSGCGPYGDCLQELDWSVGELMRTLDELELQDDTLVILTGDNGGMINEGGQAAWQAGHRLNGDLLGFKFDVWEGGHRVPFILRWPGRIEAGTVSDQLLCHVDFIATLAALTGATLDAADGPDSRNAWEAWAGDPPGPIRDVAILAPHLRSHLAIRKGPWMYIPAQGGGGWSADSGHLLGGPAALHFAGEVNSDIRDGGIVPGAAQEQLYDLASDPREQKNVIREHPDTARELRGLLKEYREESERRAAADTVE